MSDRWCFVVFLTGMFLAIALLFCLDSVQEPCDSSLANRVAGTNLAPIACEDDRRNLPDTYNMNLLRIQAMLADCDCLHPSEVALLPPAGDLP